MAFEKCPKCGFMHYATDPCRVRAELIDKHAPVSMSGVRDGIPWGLTTQWVKLESLAPIEAKTIEGVPASLNIVQEIEYTTKPKRGRPRIHPDRKAYKAEHERKRRAAKKEPKA